MRELLVGMFVGIGITYVWMSSRKLKSNLDNWNKRFDDYLVKYHGEDFKNKFNKTYRRR